MHEAITAIIGLLFSLNIIYISKKKSAGQNIKLSEVINQEFPNINKFWQKMARRIGSNKK